MGSTANYGFAGKGIDRPHISVAPRAVKRKERQLERINPRKHVVMHLNFRISLDKQVHRGHQVQGHMAE